ncbi:MAG: class IV adenylate cyclase [Planctomycetota bacterium]|jgi:predicted adenylyl cyclase CyaB
MSDEIEVKFKVDDFAAVRRALRREGAKYIATVLQLDSYYDTSDRMLLERDCGLRIRRVRCLRSSGAGIDPRPLLTAKGPRRGAGAKIRREVQTHLENPEAVTDILESLGLERTLSIEKRRATYRLGRSLVELDELPLIGRFVEIESPSKPDLERTCRFLGLTGQRITDHYINLLAKRGGLAAGRRFRLRRGTKHP